MSIHSKHMGFSKAAEAIHRKQHISMGASRAILAAGARNASAKAKRANPRLKRVKG